MDENTLHKNKGYILYLDVLGYKDILNSNREKDIDSLKKFLLKLQPKYLPIDRRLFEGCDIYKFHIRHFSDNILIFYQSIEEDVKALVGMIYLANYIQSNGVVLGFMTRGSLSYGTIEYNGKIVFGKQIVDSCELEKNNHCPSICLSKELKEFVIDNPIKGIDDLLSPFGYFHHTDRDAQDRCLTGLKLMIERLNHRSVIEPNVIDKHEWLIEEYNRYFCIEEKKILNKLPSGMYGIK